MAGKLGNPNWQKGKSGNPGGRRKMDQDVREIASGHGKEAIEKLVDLMQDPNTPPSTAVAACKEILDRAYGRAPQAITGEGGTGVPELVIRWKKPDES